MRSRKHRGWRPQVRQVSPVERQSPKETASPRAEVTFVDLPLSEKIKEAVALAGYHFMTPIQEEVLPLALEGKDIVGLAHTGSGKTAAFVIPILERIDLEKRELQALVLCPTRELAIQVHQEFATLGSGRVTSLAIYGGDSMNRQLFELKKGVQVIVATPGRLLDHLERRTLQLQGIKIAVLDEADHMLDMGFAKDVDRILSLCPPTRQTMLFSATMPSYAKRIALKYMKEPITVAVFTKAEIPVGVNELYVKIPWADKTSALEVILKHEAVRTALIFVETKKTADLLKIQLERRGFPIGILHGDISQAERIQAIEHFRSCHVPYLIATNIAARGLDIKDISHVINYDIPQSTEEYIHRVGRTGRAGKTGVAITFVAERDSFLLWDIEKFTGNPIPKVELDHFREPVGSLV